MRSKLYDKDPRNSRFSRFIEGTIANAGNPNLQQNEQEMMT